MARAPDDIARSGLYLRRYARALTGSQALGDQYVDIALEMIRQNPERLPRDADPRREVFRLFHEVWAKAERGHDRRAWDFLGGMARRERQLLLLVAVEGCSVSEAAYILDIEEAQAQHLFHLAQAAVARHTRAAILIIEDEMLIAMHLEAIVEGAGHKVCGIAADEDEALALAAQARPQLILADIHLKGGQSGIIAVRKILYALKVPVIFITGFPQDLLTGMTPEPAFVIAKPFAPETVVAAVSQALLTDRPAEPDATWRLRGRPPETGGAVRLRPAEADAACSPARATVPGALPGPDVLRHSDDNPRASEGPSCRPGARAATQGSRDARQEDSARP